MWSRSLKRLHTDCIDLYWVHIWDEITPGEEVVRGPEDIVRQGKFLYVLVLYQKRPQRRDW
jgi:aryl-alcohol dehydrogenase-like predicted oxidoreductase